jgi:hypothetical protein
MIRVSSPILLFEVGKSANKRIVNLPADFVVWAVSPEAKFLKGKLVWSNWDVDELKAMEEEIEETDKFTFGLLGWP